MFRVLAKALLISIISSILMMYDVLLFAADTASTVNEYGMKRESDGTVSQTKTLKLDPVKDSDMLSSITMAAIGVIGTRMAVAYRPITTDVYVAAAGAGAFIAGEIMSNIDFKKQMDEMSKQITVYANGDRNTAQIEDVKKLKESYQKAKKTTETKKMLQLGAAAAFAGAAAIALYKSMSENAADAQCKGALMSTKSALASCMAEPTTAASCTKCNTSLDLLSNAISIEDVNREIPGPSALNEIKDQKQDDTISNLINTGCTGASSAIASTALQTCKAASELKNKGEVSGKIKALTVINNNSWYEKYFAYQFMQSREIKNRDSLFEKFSNLIIPKSEASMMSLLGLGGGVATSFFLISGSMAVQLDSMLYVARNRAIAFGTLAGLSFMASKSSENQIKQIDENIKKIDDILNSLNGLAHGATTKNTANATPFELPKAYNPYQETIKFSNDGTIKTNCLNSDANSNCKSMADQMKNLPDFANLPESFKAIGIESAKIGDGLSGVAGISGATMQEVSNLGNKTNAIRKLLDNVQNKLNKQLKNNGKAEINFAKEQKKFLDDANSETSRILNQRGYSPEGFLASIGGNPIKTDDFGKFSKAVDAVKMEGNGNGLSNDKDLKLEFKENGPSFVDGGNSFKGEKYDMGHTEISKESGPSIFEIISNRYIQSGYSKLLEEAPAKK